MKNQQVDLQTSDTHAGNVQVHSSNMVLHDDNKLPMQLNFYKFIGRLGLLIFIIVSGWVAFSYPLIWWGTVMSLLAILGLLTLKEQFVQKTH
jgi:hypothetical protein